MTASHSPQRPSVMSTSSNLPEPPTPPTPSRSPPSNQSSARAPSRVHFTSPAYVEEAPVSPSPIRSRLRPRYRPVMSRHGAVSSESESSDGNMHRGSAGRRLGNDDGSPRNDRSSRRGQWSEHAGGERGKGQCRRGSDPPRSSGSTGVIEDFNDDSALLITSNRYDRDGIEDLEHQDLTTSDALFQRENGRKGRISPFLNRLHVSTGSTSRFPSLPSQESSSAATPIAPYELPRPGSSPNPGHQPRSYNVEKEKYDYIPESDRPDRARFQIRRLDKMSFPFLPRFLVRSRSRSDSSSSDLELAGRGSGGMERGEAGLRPNDGRIAYTRNIRSLRRSGSGMNRRNNGNRSHRPEPDFQFRSGVFSQLLQLAAPGPYTGLKKTSRPSSPSNPTHPSNYAQFLTIPNDTASSADSTNRPGIPSMIRSLGLWSSASLNGDIWDVEGELDTEDPRITGVLARRKNAGIRRGGHPAGSPFIRMNVLGAGSGEDEEAARIKAAQMRVTDILTRQAFILKLAKALMNFGAPSHRIESQLSSSAIALEIDAQFIHFPSIVIASFGDPDTRTSETHFIKCSSGDLDLGKLHQVHAIYRSVVHDEMSPAEGVRAIHQVLHSEREYKVWHRLVMAFLSCGLIAPIAFGGSFLDALAAGVLGTGLAFLQLHLGAGSVMYSNVFEISMATIISFASRGLSVSGYFCYGAVATSGVCLVLPGYLILCGALELASNNIVAGSVRMLYAIILSMFLGFGITIGSDLFYIIDPPARRAAQALWQYTTGTNIVGTFTSLGSNLDSSAFDSTPQINWNGTFTFTNTTSPQFDEALQLVSTACTRQNDWPWYRQSMPSLYLIAFVPLYSALSALWSFQPLRSKELPVMVLISSVGFLVNTVAGWWVWNRDDVVSALGAFTIGVMGNVYSRVFKGGAFTSMVPGIMFLVPSGISAAGGLATINSSGAYQDAWSEGLQLGSKMVQVSMGITVGLFGSGFLIYSFGRKKREALFAF